MTKNRQVGLVILKRRITNTPPGIALMCSSVNQVKMKKYILFLLSLLFLTGTGKAVARDIVWGYPNPRGYKQTIIAYVRLPQWVIAACERNRPLIKKLTTKTPNTPKYNKVVIYFDFNKASIKPSEKKKLKRFASQVTDKAQIKVTGYTDDIGSKKYNYWLGLRRAQNVANFLKKLGLKNNIKVISKGKCCFVTREDGHINRKFSRRVEVEVVEKE
jgi:outer membrane protein OmpA-like peptidoglycan-associated protein